MLELFHTLILALALIAPGEVGCSNATLCWVTFTDPAAVEYVTPTQIPRLRALIEIKILENK